MRRAGVNASIKTEQVCFYTPHGCGQSPPEWLAHALALLRSNPGTLRLHALQPYLSRFPSPSDMAQTNLKWPDGSWAACLRLASAAGAKSPTAGV